MPSATELNPKVYKTATQTNVLETWRKYGFTPPSEIEQYRLKWLEFRSLHLREEEETLAHPDGNTQC
jgi:hypothetical protein